MRRSALVLTVLGLAAASGLVLYAFSSARSSGRADETLGVNVPADTVPLVTDAKESLVLGLAAVIVQRLPHQLPARLSGKEEQFARDASDALAGVASQTKLESIEWFARRGLEPPPSVTQEALADVFEASARLLKSARLDHASGVVRAIYVNGEKTRSFENPSVRFGPRPTRCPNIPLPENDPGTVMEVVFQAYKLGSVDNVPFDARLGIWMQYDSKLARWEMTHVALYGVAPGVTIVPPPI